MRTAKTIGALILAAAAVLTGCGGTRGEMVTPHGGTSTPPANFLRGQIAEGKELICTVESREEAEEIASLYGIELVECSEYVAAFHTEEDPYEVIRRGEEKGWPSLEINHVITLDDPVFSQNWNGANAAEP